MSTLPVVNPADFLPAPIAIEALDYETLIAAWKVKFKALMLAIGLDYDVDSLETDPGVIIAEAMSYLRLTDRARVNGVYRALRLACAKGTDLDGLAADRGVKRLVYVPAVLSASGAVVTPAVMQGDISLLLDCWLAMQKWGSGSPLGVEYYARRIGLQNLADAHVIDHPGEGRMTCVLLPIAGLSDADAETMRATIGTGLMDRCRRPGSVSIDTVLADIVTVPYTGVISIRRGASPSALLASATAALTAYMLTRRRIGALVPVSAMTAAQYAYGEVEAQASQPATDVVVPETAAAVLGAVNITVQVVDD